MKRYLFSAIGKTDPVSYFHDGALIHIIRYFKPDYVCCYMTKEIIDNEKEDKEKVGIDRYTYCFDEIKKVINKNFAVEYIRDENMVDPSDMDVFYRIFLKKVNEIEQIADSETNGNYEILLNISSGTPAQKATLQTIASLGNDKIKAVQVISPHQKSNPRFENEKGVKFEEIWDTNDDNRVGAEIRIRPSDANNFVRFAAQREVIKELIKNYDYSAVLELLNLLDCDKHLKSLVKSAVYRLEMNLNLIGENLNNNEKQYFIVNVGSDILKNVEYILGLLVKIKKKNYIDFIRGITPVIVDLFERRCVKIDKNMIDKICAEDIRKGIGKPRLVKQFKKDKIKEYDSNLYDFLDRKYKSNGGFREGDANSSTYLLIMEYCLNKNKNINVQEYDIAKKLRDVEQEIRNIVAHEIEYMSDEKVKEMTGLSVKEIFDLIVKFANYCDMKIDEEKISAYDNMNKFINNYLDKMLL